MFLPMRILIILLSLFFSNATNAQMDSSAKMRIDTLRVQNIASPNTAKWYENSAMPWISAILIALLGVLANYMISKRTQAAAKNTIERQFSLSLYSSNRQAWINSVRETLSELLTQCSLLNIAIQSNDKNGRASAFEKVAFRRNQLRLFLSPLIEKHKNVLENLVELINLIDRHQLNSEIPMEQYDNLKILKCQDKLVESGRIMLYDEWNKIQEAQKRDWQ